MRNMFHGLEPIVRISKLCQDQRIVYVFGWIVVLKPMLITSQLFFHHQGMIKALGNVTVFIFRCIPTTKKNDKQKHTKRYQPANRYRTRRTNETMCVCACACQRYDTTKFMRKIQTKKKLRTQRSISFHYFVLPEY